MVYDIVNYKLRLALHQLTVALKTFNFLTIGLVAISSFFQLRSTQAQTIASVDESTVVESHSVMKSEKDLLIVRKCSDFTLSGKGNNGEWTKAEWVLLTKLDTGGRTYESKFKILYSPTGIYLLFYGQDDKITTKAYNDFESIFNGDVFEVFFHPDPQIPVYFEYEVNQLEKELILTISHLNKQSFTSWVPWRHEGKNRSGIKKLVDVGGGEKQVNATIREWSVEIYFPYGALGLLPGVPPKSGSLWNANFCRLDYDSGKMIKWSWTTAIKSSFHELEKFLSIKFE